VHPVHSGSASVSRGFAWSRIATRALLSRVPQSHSSNRRVGERRVSEEMRHSATENGDGGNLTHAPFACGRSHRHLIRLPASKTGRMLVVPAPVGLETFILKRGFGDETSKRRASRCSHAFVGVLWPPRKARARAGRRRKRRRPAPRAKAPVGRRSVGVRCPLRVLRPTASPESAGNPRRRRSAHDAGQHPAPARRRRASAVPAATTTPTATPFLNR